MQKPHGSSVKAATAAREQRLVEKLRAHPEMLERFEAILGLTESAGGPARTADQVEELLIQEVRRLGNRTMQAWAVGAEAQAAEQLRAAKPQARLRKKKP